MDYAKLFLTLIGYGSLENWPYVSLEAALGRTGPGGRL